MPFWLARGNEVSVKKISAQNWLSLYADAKGKYMGIGARAIAHSRHLPCVGSTWD